jgi:peroxiredoxin Q/BCP
MKTSSLLLLAPLALVACDHESSSPPATTSAATSPPPAAAAPPSSAAAGDLAVGAPPPDFTRTAQDGTALHLSGLKGKPVVVYFYPKDETPGCTKEACSFRDAWDALSKKGVVLIGVSADTDDSHKAFAAHYKLPFAFVSDADGSLAKSFGVPFHDGFTARQSFVIGPDGLLKKIYRKVDVTVHAQEIMADVQ